MSDFDLMTAFGIALLCGCSQRRGGRIVCGFDWRGQGAAVMMPAGGMIARHSSTFRKGFVNPSMRLAVCLVVAVAVSGATAQANEELTTIKKRLEQRFTDLAITEIRPSPVAGLYEMDYGTRTVLVTADGRYLVAGELIDLQNQRNLTAERRAILVVRAVNTLGDDKMIVIGPSAPKRTVTVFTDVDCQYCRRFHQDVPQLNAAGVQVRYLLYPRAGVNSESYKRSVAVWCAKDRAKAIGVAKAGGKIEMKTCANPLDQHLKLGADIGIEGTPALVFDDGRVIPGYVPAARLLAVLGLADGDKADPKR